MALERQLWLPEYGDNLFMPDDLADALSLSLPVSCTNSEHETLNNYNIIVEGFANDNNSLEEVLDAASDLGVDAATLLTRTEWLYSELLSEI